MPVRLPLGHIANACSRYKKNKSITMMREKSPPPEYNNIHVTENYKFNQQRVSLNEYLERKFPSKKDFWTFF